MKKIKLKKSKRSSNRGFSLIELMAIMIIVGALSAIAIASATGIINRSKKEKVSQNMKNVTMAAKMYVQNNRDLLPRNIGEEKIIKLSVLKDSNYLKETVVNEDGESCMNESLVRIYKLSNSDYAYTPFLYCGDEKAPAKVTVPGPEISGFSFSNTTDVSKANFSFKIKGNSAGTGEIYSYTYAILVKNNNTPDFTEVYSSGSVSGNNKKEISFESKPLVEYIDVTGYSMVKVRVTAINKDGGSSTADSSNVGAGATLAYNDTVKPECVAGGSIGEAVDDDDWINKENIDTEKYPRIISVKCTDGNGSGCKRDLFSDSWPDQQNYIFGTKFANIKIEDNAVMDKSGNLKEPNSNLCRVKVNADVKSPAIVINAVNPIAGKPKETASVSVNENEKKNPDKVYPSGTLKADSYVNQKGDTIKWLNAENYPDGIKFTVKATDNLYLYKYTWETNPAYVRGGSSDAEIKANVSMSNPDALKNEVILVPNKNVYENSNTGLLEYNFEVSLKAEGMRYGRLTVYDKAGNYTVVHVYANIDRTAPPIPNTLYQKANTKKAYQGNADWTSQNLVRSAWSTEYVFAYVNGQQEDHESGNTELSGWKQFKYVYSKQSGISRSGLNVTGYTFTNSAETVCTDKDGSNKVGYIMKDQGTHTIKFRSCDKAENCSDFNDNKKYNPYPYVKIDTIAPKCEVKLDHPRGDPLCVNNPTSSSSYCGTSVTSKMNGWLGYKDNVGNMSLKSNEKKIAVVSALCTDVNASKANDTTYASLCDGINTNGTNYKKPTDSELVTLYDKYSKFPVVMQPSYKYQTDINTTTAGAAGNNSAGYVIDIAGNRTECSSASPAYYTVKIDYTRPVCTASTTSNGGSYNGEWLPKGSSVKYETNGTDNGTTSSGVWDYYTKYSTTFSREINTNNATTNRYGANKFYNGTYTYTTLSDGSTNHLYVYDKAGNRSNDPCPGKTIKIDATGPTCAVEAKASGSSSKKDFSRFTTDFGAYRGNEWVNGDYSIIVHRICATDVNNTNQDPHGSMDGSGCTNDLDERSRTYRKISNGLVNAAKGAISDSSSGSVRDYVGNTTNCALFSNVMIDDTYPTCSVTRSAFHPGAGEWNNAAEGVTVTSTCSDTGSGCDENPEKGSEYKATKSHKYTAIPNGILNRSNGGSIDYGNSGWVIDRVGNVSKQKCEANKPVKIDDQKPNCNDEVYNNNGQWVNASGTKPYFKASCNDGSGSGCVKDCFGRVFNNDYNGTQTVKNVAEDKVGNKKNCSKYGQSYMIKVQVTLPACAAWSNTPYDYTVGQSGSQNGVTVYWKCENRSNNGSTPARITSCDGSSSLSGNASNQTYTKYVTVQDEAGNSNSCSEPISSTTYYNYYKTTNCTRCCARSGGCYDRYTQSATCTSTGCTCPWGYDLYGRTCVKETYNSSYESNNCAVCGNNGGFYSDGWSTFAKYTNESTAYDLRETRTLYKGSKTSGTPSFSTGKRNEDVSSCSGFPTAPTGPTTTVTPKPSTSTPKPSTSTPKPSSAAPSSPSPDSDDLSGLFEPCRIGKTAVFANTTGPFCGTVNNAGGGSSTQFQILGKSGIFTQIQIVTRNGKEEAWSGSGGNCKGLDTMYIKNVCVRKVGETGDCVNICKDPKRNL